MTRMSLALLLGLAAPACIQGEPAALPEATPQQATITDVRRVRHGEVEGLLGRPQGDQALPAVLLLVDDLGEAAQAEVLSRSSEGLGVLAIAPPTSAEAAAAYLAGMPWTAEQTRVCLRERSPCPEAPEGGP